MGRDDDVDQATRRASSSLSAGQARRSFGWREDASLLIERVSAVRGFDASIACGISYGFSVL
jgi:hypothetical protein